MTAYRVSEKGARLFETSPKVYRKYEGETDKTYVRYWDDNVGSGSLGTGHYQLLTLSVRDEDLK